MHTRTLFQSWLARAVSSVEARQLLRQWYGWRRRMRGEGPTLHVFLKVSDPYSYLLATVLPDLQQRFAVDIRCHLVQRLPAASMPEPTLWQRNAVEDCRALAELYDIPFEAVGAFPDAAIVAALERELVTQLEGGQAALPRLAERLGALWRGGYRQPSGAADAEDRQEMMVLREYFSRSEGMLQRLGHYASAMIYYEGEWYWGLDRLDHLERRLAGQGLGRYPGSQVRYDRQNRDFCSLAGARQLPDEVRDHPLELFFSIRSPYSYLGLEKAAQFCHHYGLNLVVRPVLPMVMRGLPVPRNKTLYIFLDAKREAEKAGIPFGFVADPLGEGVEACYQLFDYACEQDRGLDYLLSVARGVYAEAVDIADPRGLRKVAERAGLDWAQARRQLGNTVWTEWVQTNLEALYGMGFWGVPTFRFGETRTWGQDRLWRVERDILARARPNEPSPAEYQDVLC